MELLGKVWFFPMIDELFIISFSVLLLFFFIVMLDSIRLKAETVQYGIRFYNIFKIILILAIWVSCILVWGWIELAFPSFLLISVFQYLLFSNYSCRFNAIT